jgi:DNA polymerase elongation subunit (family B)
MKTYIIYDIETAGLPFEDFDESCQEYLLRGAKNEEEQQKKIAEMALAPLTGKIVCLGMRVMQFKDNAWSEERCGAFINAEQLAEQEPEILPSGARMVRCSEEKILEGFWRICSLYSNPHFITFNGRGFDAPFIMLRSAVLRIRPPFNLMQGTRYNYRENHTDLLDELCFMNPQSTGATRRYNFDFVTKAFGIPSPKGEGIDGSKVGQLYAEGKYQDIAEYCLRDVYATWDLYQTLKNYLPDLR